MRSRRSPTPCRRFSLAAATLGRRASSILRRTRSTTSPTLPCRKTRSLSTRSPATSLAAALGQASPGNYLFNGSPTADFSSAVTNRGQGDQSLDFAPWGGVIAIDVQNSSGVAA